MQGKNIVKSFLKTLETNPKFKVLKVKKDNQWEDIPRSKLFNNIQNCILQLKDRNIEKGDRVAYKGNNSLEWISWNLATQSMGAVWVPMYEQQTKNQCQYIVDNCEPKLLITNENIQIENTTTIKNTIENYDLNNSNIELVDNDLSTLIYTSGTTGNPKGVMLSHENIVSNIDAIRMRFKDIQPELTSLNILPWAHIYGLTCELYYNLFL